MKKISEIVNYYATQSYDSTEVEDDENWAIDDLISLRDAVDVEIQKRNLRSCNAA